jgi:hypothetical protein
MPRLDARRRRPSDGGMQAGPDQGVGIDREDVGRE